MPSYESNGLRKVLICLSKLIICDVLKPFIQYYYIKGYVLIETQNDIFTCKNIVKSQDQ